MTNAQTAREWSLAALGDDAAVRQALRRGVDQRRGGRRSSASTPPTCSGSGTGSAAATRYDSAIGLSLMIAIGPERSGEMLAGFHAMDEHFRTAPLEQNLPMLLGLIGIWYNNFFGAETLAVLPVQPATWRSCRRTSSSSTWRATASPSTATATAVDVADRPDRLGPAGHQRPARLLPADPPGHEAHPVRLHRLLPAATTCVGDHHDLLMANFFAQTEALAFGKTRRGGARPRACPSDAGAAPHVRRQPPDEHDPRDRAHAARCSASSSRSTSTRSSPRARSGTSTASTSGASSSARSSRTAIVPELDAADEPDARPRLVDQHADPPLPRRRGGGRGLMDRTPWRAILGWALAGTATRRWRSPSPAWPARSTASAGSWSPDRRTRPPRSWPRTSRATHSPRVAATTVASST